MWLDNASEVDILFYEPYANVIADISKTQVTNRSLSVYLVSGEQESQPF